MWLASWGTGDMERWTEDGPEHDYNMDPDVELAFDQSTLS
ncbi:hypothetical protein LEMLEM_LOCUS1255 [Lemmus lemmus]